MVFPAKQPLLVTALPPLTQKHHLQSKTICIRTFNDKFSVPTQSLTKLETFPNLPLPRNLESGYRAVAQIQLSHCTPCTGEKWGQPMKSQDSASEVIICKHNSHTHFHRGLSQSYVFQDLNPDLQRPWRGP